ncbi:MAG: 6,7-dimethyl-8-ribityllumazine synthase [Planctomycetes bacterium]|nr:6,7-dimethyl-8-ribityllumazine synthase [Planctomycetota bacterium]
MDIPAPNHSAIGLRIGILVARFNAEVTSGLLRGAVDALLEAGVQRNDISIHATAGAVELPLGCDLLITQTQPHAVIALGAVIRGETEHYEHVSRLAAEGLMNVMLRRQVPVAFGVLTCATDALALARSRNDSHNKGREAALAALELANLARAPRNLP